MPHLTITNKELTHNPAHETKYINEFKLVNCNFGFELIITQ